MKIAKTASNNRYMQSFSARTDHECAVLYIRLMISVCVKSADIVRTVYNTIIEDKKNKENKE